MTKLNVEKTSLLKNGIDVSHRIGRLKIKSIRNVKMQSIDFSWHKSISKSCYIKSNLLIYTRIYFVIIFFLIDSFGSKYLPKFTKITNLGLKICFSDQWITL